MIDRKYIDAKVIEAHIVPGQLLITRYKRQQKKNNQFSQLDPNH